ncbi:MAG: LiaI-LiaF-like domain-containing protein [Candidatus Kapaibacterium sp.]
MKNSINTSTVFWGTFLIFLGLFFLLMNLGVMKWQISGIWDFWPLLLIFWGISLLKLPDIIKYILAGLSSLLLSLMIISFFSGIFWFFNKGEFHIGNNREYKGRKEMMEVEMDSAYKYALIEFDGGAGNFELAGRTDKLVELYSGQGLTVLNSFPDDNGYDMAVEVKLGVKGKFKSRRYADISLNDSVLWDMSIDAGACNIDFDMSEIKVSKLDLSTGASDVTLKFGDRHNDVKIDISGGLSNISVFIPKTMDAEILTETGLSNRDFKGFTHKEKGRYVSPLADNGKGKILIEIEGGMSNFDVVRY